MSTVSVTEEAAKVVNISKLKKDLISREVKGLTMDEIRFLVNAYYTIQEDRKRTCNQLRGFGDQPTVLLQWFAENNKMLENELKKTLDIWTAQHVIASRIRQVKGIGPVLSAGLVAHIDIRKAPTVGHIWRFAGLDPTSKWEKGQKRPWNADLKTICWKIGESFCKVSGGENPSPYGLLYKQRKVEETLKNEAGGYKDQAEESLATKKYDKSTEAYKLYVQGKLPLARIDQRAKRWATKIFLSHMHQIWFEFEFGVPAPVPYAIAHLNHAHFIPVPTEMLG